MAFCYSNSSIDLFLYQPIGDVANVKRHQQLDKIFIIFLPTLHRGICTVVFKKTLTCNTPAKLDAILFALHMLAIMHAFHTAYICAKNTGVSDRDFLQTALLISTFVRVKNQDFVSSLVAFGISNICYCVTTLVLSQAHKSFSSFYDYRSPSVILWE